MSIPDGINTQRNIMPLRTEAARFPYFGIDEAWLHEASAVRYEVNHNPSAGSFNSCGRYTMKRMPNEEGMKVLRSGVTRRSDGRAVYDRDGVCPGVESAMAYDKMDFNIDGTGPVLLADYPYTWNYQETQKGRIVKRKHMAELFEAIKRRKYVPSWKTSGGDMSFVGTETTSYTYRWPDEEWEDPEVTTRENSAYLIRHSWDISDLHSVPAPGGSKSETTLSNVHVTQNTPMAFASVRPEWVSRATCVFAIDVRLEHYRVKWEDGGGYYYNGVKTVIDDISETYYHSIDAQMSAAGEGVSLTIPLADLIGIASAAATKAGATDVPCPSYPASDTEEYFELKVKANFTNTIFEIASDYCVPETA